MTNTHKKITCTKVINKKIINDQTNEQYINNTRIALP